MQKGKLFPMVTAFWARVQSVCDYWGLGLHRRLHLLGDATAALLFKSRKRGESRGGGTACPQILLAIELAQRLQGHNIHLPSAAVAAGSKKRWVGPKFLGVCGQMACSYCCKYFGTGPRPPLRVTQVTGLTGCCGLGTAGTCWPAEASFHRWAASWCS